MSRGPVLSGALYSVVAAMGTAIAFTHFSCGSLSAQTLAFPDAVGFGKDAVGGRGNNPASRNQRLYIVSSLADNPGNPAPGTLRHACLQSGPRFVVFARGGTVSLKAPININNPYLTISGQEAPGGGILLRHDGSTRNFTGALISISANHVVLRHLRFRRGPSAVLEQNGGCVTIGNSATNVIVDHCSISWSTDENVTIWDNARNVTFQNCAISEALQFSTHAEDGDDANNTLQDYELQDHSMGAITGENVTKITFFRNLFAHSGGRNPRFSPNVDSNNQFLNNYVYNYAFFGGEITNQAGGTTRVDMVGNVYDAGPDTRTSRHAVHLFPRGRLYVRDNIFPRPAGAATGQWGIAGAGESQAGKNPAPSSRRANNPQTNLEGIPLASASQLKNLLLGSRGAGAFLPVSDAVDNRVLNEMESGGPNGVRSENSQGKDFYGLINDPTDAPGGWPGLASGSRPTDSDGDYLPDNWERDNGLNANNGSDWKADRDGDGYLNIEEYLNNTDPSWNPDRARVTLRNRSTLRYLDAGSNNLPAMKTGGGGNSFQWELEHSEADYFTVRNVSNGRYLAVDPNNADRVFTKGGANGDDRHWKVVDFGGGVFKLFNRVTSRALSLNPGQNNFAYLEPDSVSAEREWNLIPAGNASSTQVAAQAAGIEVGESSGANSWNRVAFSDAFAQVPVVTLGAPSYNGPDDSTVRIRNVSRDGFEWRIEEWGYHDGGHAQETIAWMAVEPGGGTLGGVAYEALVVQSDHTWGARHPFAQGFSQRPVVFATVASANDASPVAVRIDHTRTGADGFTLRIDEELPGGAGGNGRTHDSETVHVIAFAPGTAEDSRFKVGRSAREIDHAEGRVGFGRTFSSPIVLASLQSFYGSDTAVLRIIGQPDGRMAAGDGFDAFVEEGHADPDRRNHTTEEVGWIVFSGE